MHYSISGQEIQRLLEADWKTPGGAIHVCDDLTLAEAERSQLFRNARLVLHTLAVSGGTKATAGGNLNRKFVGELLEQLDLAPATIEEIRAVNKVINEFDVWPLHITRVVLELAGLVRRHSGKFQVIQKRRDLMDDEHAGALYNLLFLTVFRKLNLAYLDSMSDVPSIQQTMAVSLFMVSRLTSEWVALEDIAEDLFLAQVREQMPYYLHFDSTPHLANSRVIRPLVYLGLVEQRRLEGRWGRTELRKTELFDRVLQFNVDVTVIPDPPLSGGRWM